MSKIKQTLLYKFKIQSIYEILSKTRVESLHTATKTSCMSSRIRLFFSGGVGWWKFWQNQKIFSTCKLQWLLSYYWTEHGLDYLVRIMNRWVGKPVVTSSGVNRVHRNTQTMVWYGMVWYGMVFINYSADMVWGMWGMWHQLVNSCLGLGWYYLGLSLARRDLN